MKNFYILLAAFLFFNWNVNAQFTDDMESYTDGEPIIGNWWTDAGCGGAEGCALMSTSIQSHNYGVLSGVIPGDGTTSSVLDLGNKIFGGWGLEFWMYIPSGKEGAMNLQNEVPIGAGQSIVGDILFNPNLETPGVGKITDSAMGEVSFNFPHDEWFRIVMDWDISLGIQASSWELYINGVMLIPAGTPYTNENGDYPSSLGGINFLSYSTNTTFYLDDFTYQDVIDIDPDPDPIPVFTDDMESYTDGEPIIGSWWTDAGCGGAEGCALMSTSIQSHNYGVLSGVIPGDGTTSSVLDLGNKIFADWGLEFWMYIPSGKEGAMNLQNEVPIGAGQSIVGDILFNPNLETPGVGKITDSAMGELSFNFPHDEWFRIIMMWDISLGIQASTWKLYINGVLVIPAATPYTNENGDYPSSLGGVNFLSYSTNTTFYLDDFQYGTPYIFNIEDQTDESFKIYPNPTQNTLNIDTQETIKSLKIYNVLGKIINEITKLKSIDVSNLSSGIYFIEVSTDTGSSIQKFIKK